LDNKAPDAFRTISEVADELDLPQHVLRFWESRFHEIKPMKRGGGRRYYRPDDIDLLRGIRHLLYGEGYTIRGVQRILREQGPKFVQVVWQEGAPQPPHGRIEEEEFAEEAVTIEKTTRQTVSIRPLSARQFPELIQPTARSTASPRPIHRIRRRNPYQPHRVSRRPRWPVVGSAARIYASCTPRCMSLRNAAG
jgi:DNA-binding transcriptional MerR regulator